MEEKKFNNNDQALELTDLLNEVNNHNDSKNHYDEEDNQTNNEQDDISHNVAETSQKDSEDKTMDVLNLPPRKEVHSQKKNRTHVKISRPFIRLALVIVLLLVVIGLLLFYGEGVINI